MNLPLFSLRFQVSRYEFDLHQIMLRPYVSRNK
jgi:hypothetical protein